MRSNNSETTLNFAVDTKPPDDKYSFFGFVKRIIYSLYLELLRIPYIGMVTNFFTFSHSIIPNV